MDEYGKAEEVSCQDCGIGMSIPGPNGEHRCAGCWMQDSARRIHTLTSRLAESEAELATERERTEELRDGPIGPYESCSDCGRKMVWSHAGTVSPTWMCPRCTLRRAQLTESSLSAAVARAERVEKHLAETDEALDNANRERDAAIAKLRALDLALDLARVREVEIRFRKWMRALAEVALAQDVALYEDRPGTFVDVLQGRIAAARAEAVKQAFEWLECNVVSDLHLGWADHVGAQYARYLAHLAGKEPR